MIRKKLSNIEYYENALESLYFFFDFLKIIEILASKTSRNLIDFSISIAELYLNFV